LISVTATTVGLLLLVVVGRQVALSRNTDLADAEGSVATEFRHQIPEHAPPLRFQDVAAEVGISFRHGRGERRRLLPEDTGSGCAWGDFDGDGDPDLYAVNFPQDPARPDPVADSNRLYRNDRRQFVDVTDAAGVGDPDGFGMGASFADVDNDGDLDLYVTNHGPNRLFRNRGDGTFEEDAARAGVAAASWSCGVTWGDVDRDQDLDLYVCNYLEYSELPEGSSSGSPEWEGIPFTLNPNSYDPQANQLYLNRGDGTFEEAGVRLGVDNRSGRSLGATFCDFDGDGWLDLYVNNDVSQNAMYLNLGDQCEEDGKRFLEISALTGTADPRGSMGLSVGDVSDRKNSTDGYPDLFITHWVAQENALYIGMRFAPGQFEFRDRVRQYRLGEVSTDTVGWGAAMVDLDLDGHLDIAVANGSTLELQGNKSLLTAEPLFLFWSDAGRFHDLAPASGGATGLHCARGLAAADFDADGDVDLAVSVNRGTLLLLRNESETPHHALTVRLEAPASLCFGARIEVKTPAGVQTRWWGADVSYASMHHTDVVFGLGEESHAESVQVFWADGSDSLVSNTPAELVVVRRVN
jgi:hypothetical protein